MIDFLPRVQVAGGSVVLAGLSAYRVRPRNSHATDTQERDEDHENPTPDAAFGSVGRRLDSPD